MPNSENFPNYISVPIDQRPSRLNSSDTDIFQISSKQILFGTNDRDVVELWFYNPNGSFAAHITLNVHDEGLGLNTIVDNTGAFEFVNLDMTSILNRVGLEQGRYQMVANFFRSEVGTEIGNKLRIVDISPDRTEIKLQPIQTDDSILSDMYEFTVPSVPKNESQGLISFVFGKTANTSHSLTVDMILSEMDRLQPDTSARINNTNSKAVYAAMISGMIEQIYSLVLDNIYADKQNLNIQEYDLQTYIRQAVLDVIKRYKESKAVDPKFNIF